MNPTIPAPALAAEPPSNRREECSGALWQCALVAKPLDFRIFRAGQPERPARSGGDRLRSTTHTPAQQVSLSLFYLQGKHRGREHSFEAQRLKHTLVGQPTVRPRLWATPHEVVVVQP